MKVLKTPRYGRSLRKQSGCWFGCLIAAQVMACCCSVLCEVNDQGSPPTPSVQKFGSAPLITQSAETDDVLHLTVGRSVLLTSAGPLRRVYVGNPAVLQTYTSGPSEIVVTAKAAGQSSMLLWDEAGGRRLYAVFADVDPDALRISLAAAFPGSLIHAEAGEGKIFLTGTVTTDAIAEGATKMALQYAREVVNSLQVVPVHGKQVQLKLRIVEVDRTRLEQMGINIFAGGRTAVATSTGQFGSVASGSGASLTGSNPLDIFLFNAKLNVGLTVQDLEQKQILQVLAEPTLTTLSGLPARFLSGGEFPFPVIQGGTGNANAITVQFRPYGVRVDFTPTVNPDSSIHLRLSPEVSALDYSNAVTISGFTIPALSTRRSDTEVEIKDGESFIVSGLLDHRTTEIMSRIPGIANIPVLGQLFRSKNLSRSVVELVIIVTASVIDPLGHDSVPVVDLPKQGVPNLDADAFDVSIQRKSQTVERPPILGTGDRQ
jgi:pilus assembly protein CpaC